MSLAKGLEKDCFHASDGEHFDPFDFWSSQDEEDMENGYQLMKLDREDARKKMLAEQTLADAKGEEERVLEETTYMETLVNDEKMALAKNVSELSQGVGSDINGIVLPGSSQHSPIRKMRSPCRLCEVQHPAKNCILEIFEKEYRNNAIKVRGRIELMGMVEDKKLEVHRLSMYQHMCKKIYREVPIGKRKYLPKCVVKRVQNDFGNFLATVGRREHKVYCERPAKKPDTLLVGTEARPVSISYP